MKNGMVFLAAAGLVFAAADGVAGTVYQCKGKDGAPVYSDSPCGSDAKPVKKFESRPKAGETTWCLDAKAPQELVDQCVDAWRSSLRDPRAAYADGGVLVHDLGEGVRQVFVDGHAKNGYGGFNAMSMRCTLDKAGQIDPDGTGLWITLNGAYAELNKSLPPAKIEVCKE